MPDVWLANQKHDAYVGHFLRLKSVHVYPNSFSGVKWLLARCQSSLSWKLLWKSRKTMMVFIALLICLTCFIYWVFVHLYRVFIAWVNSSHPNLCPGRRNRLPYASSLRRSRRRLTRFVEECWRTFDSIQASLTARALLHCLWHFMSLRYYLKQAYFVNCHPPQLVTRQLIDFSS